MKQINSAVLFVLFVLLCSWSTVSIAQQQNPLDVALRHLEKNRDKLQLTATDIANYRVSDLYSSRHNGVTHVYLQQEHDGIMVEQAITNVNILPNGEVLSMGNRFVADLQARVNTTTPALSAAEAVQSVLRRFQKREVATIELQEKVSDQHYIFRPDGIALEEVPVRLVYQTMADKSVRLAWRVELYEMDAYNWWNARVDAQTGEVLAHHNQVVHCDFDHSSDCAEPHTHAPLKSAPVQTRKQEKTTKSNVLANTYRVYPVPVESPIHGNRELITDPSDATASPFGWHDIDGAAGPEYTITRGNNVHAYHDIFNRNFSVGGEPDGGPSLDFDVPLDLSTEKPYTQIEPAVVNLFYWNNVMHDMWYQYGFDEASGNFQVNNYGNGGIEEDAVRAEALDGSGTNNANFGTGADGSGARMQMYIWTNEQLPPPPNDSLTVDAPMGVAGRYEMAPADFGGLLPITPISGKVVLVDDGTGVTSDACDPIVNGADISGNIAMIDRGDCEFGFKVLAAEEAGALAVIVCQNVAEPVFGMGPGLVGDQVTIPSLMISLQHCDFT